ncbi:uncharacterized protein [Rhodnius prolixus]|uniref:Uncharacterized protein n=2 Tax=Rhodnius TaxID=13248 RepID=T1HI62_RHOPR
MSSFSSGNGERPTVPPEYDCVRRKAKVSIYVSDNSGFAPTSTYKHWALVFEFEDEAVRVIEGIGFEGLLLPSFTKVKDPSAKFNSRKGSVTISPELIRDLALNNPYNNQTFNIITCNCQNWVNAILEQLGFAKDTTVGDVIGIFIGQ